MLKRMLWLFVVLGGVLGSATGCENGKEDVTRRLPQAEGCSDPSGTWKLQALACNGNPVDLAGSGILEVKAELTATRGVTTVAFANGCKVRLETALEPGVSQVRSTPVSETCLGTCNSYQCDGVPGTAPETWNCGITATTLTLSASGAQLCSGGATAETWARD